MIDCVILGDSIAVGIHQQRTECAVYAKSGINTWQFNSRFPGEFFSDYVIISLGSNDHRGIKTLDELTKLRRRIMANKKVIWILPAGNNENSGVDIKKIQSLVMLVAKSNNDIVIPITNLSADKIHPSSKGYQDLSRSFPR